MLKQTHIEKIKESRPYSQVCVWAGTTVSDNEIKDFEKFFKDEYKIRVKFIEVWFKKSTDVAYCLFKIHEDDVSGFATKRFSIGIRWIEDVIDNDKSLFPKRIKDMRTW
jgi:hypothetical protein